MIMSAGVIGAVCAATKATDNEATTLSQVYMIGEMDSPRVLVPRFRPRFADPDEPSLVEMRRKEKLDEVVGDPADDWRVIGKLAAWTCARVQNGEGPNMEPAWSAPALLRQIDEGRKGFACGTFSHIFVGALASFGIVARTIGLTAIDTPLTKGSGVWNHATSEVWSDHWGKWVYVDAELILYYELNGLPLSAMELQDCLMKGVTPTQRHFDDAEAEKWIAIRKFEWWKRDYFSQFQMPNYDLDNNHVAEDFMANGRPPAPPFLVYWPKMAPWRAHYYADRYRYLTTSNPEDVNWPINTVEIRMSLNERDCSLAVTQADGKDRVSVELFAYAPYGQSVMIRLDQRGDWTDIPSRPSGDYILSCDYVWPLHEGVNMLEARVRTRHHRLGRVSYVKVEKVQQPARTR